MSVLLNDGARHDMSGVICKSGCVRACCWLQFCWNEASSSWVGSPECEDLPVSSAKIPPF